MQPLLMIHYLTSWKGLMRASDGQAPRKGLGLDTRPFPIPHIRHLQKMNLVTGGKKKNLCCRSQQPSVARQWEFSALSYFLFCLGCWDAQSF